MQWTSFPSGPLECSGLPWLDDTLPDLWRLPGRLASSLPDGVRRQMRFPAGASARIGNAAPVISCRCAWRISAAFRSAG